MPGFAQFLDVESSVKLLNNLRPDQFDVADWETLDQLRPVAHKLAESVLALVDAATGSQKQLARDLVGVAEQLADALDSCSEEAKRIAGMDPDQDDIEQAKYALAPNVATISGAISALPGVLESFDEKKLKAKRFVFG